MHLLYTLLRQTQRQRVSDRSLVPVLEDLPGFELSLILLWPQLGDFDSLEYAWWIQRYRSQLQDHQISVRAVGIGDQDSGQQFCDYTGFPTEELLLDSTAELHHKLDLYRGLAVQIPGLSAGQKAWMNLILMCAGIGSPGTLREVLRGYTGDRQAPQLIAPDEKVRAKPLPPLQGSSFDRVGRGFQRPFELATLRLRNMVEVLSHWHTYVPDPQYLTQRGGTFLFDSQGTLVYEHRDPGILGFAETMSRPLSFLLPHLEPPELDKQSSKSST